MAVKRGTGGTGRKTSAPRGRRDPFEPRGASRKSKPVPFSFVLDELAPLDPVTRPMFGCLAVYIGERIVFILRDKGDGDSDDGVWVASEADQREAILGELPALAPIDIFGEGSSGWRKLSSTHPEFEESVLHACELVLAHDPRIGKIPGTKRKKREPGSPVVKRTPVRKGSR